MTIKQIYRIILASIGLLGITLQILKDGFGMLLYYTVLSNLFVLICLLYLIYSEYYSIKTTTLFFTNKRRDNHSYCYYIYSLSFPFISICKFNGLLESEKLYSTLHCTPWFYFRYLIF